jgi:hypothetical protein
MDMNMQEGTPLSRRGFLIATVVSVAGLTLTSPFEEVAGAQSGGVYDFMDEYASQLGFTQESDLIAQYMENLPGSLRSEVVKVNTKMKLGGFNDFSSSNVCVAEQERLFFYTATHDDEFNACAAFYNRRYAQHRDMMEGPTLIGLAMAARYLRTQKNYSSDACRSLLYPAHALKSSAGTFEKGYAIPDEFKADRGVVKVDYKNLTHDASKKRGKGKITVVGIDDREDDRKVVLNKDFTINYDVA